MCWCDGGQEQQSAKSLIITGGKCEAFWGCQSERTREGEEMPGWMWLSVAAGSGGDGDGVLWERVVACWFGD